MLHFIMISPRRRFLVALVVLASVGMFLLLIQRPIKHGDYLFVTMETIVSAPIVTSPSAMKRVTKSLAELRQSVTVPELSDHVLFFNRVPKSGSEMLVLLLQWLQGKNGFRHIRLGGGNVRKLSRIQQEELVEEVTQRLRDEAVPVSFDRHVYFLNFSRFDRQSPTFINLVRDPIDKAASRFYYARATPNPKNSDIAGAPPFKLKKFKSKDFEECVKTDDPECIFKTGQSYDLTIPYFCGHHDYCTVLNDQRALDSAKENVERYFPVVGVLEDLNATLTLLEHRLPYFFKGVRHMYYNELKEPHRNKNKKKVQNVTRATRKHLEKELDTEYEFYYWLRARLLRQQTEISPR